MRKNNWSNALFTLIFIALPSLIMFYFLLPTWSNKEVLAYSSMWLVAIGFCLYSFLINILFIYYKILSLESINFNIPITLCLMSLFLSYKLPTWAMFLIVLSIIIFTFPINVWTNKYKNQKLIKINKKN